MRKSMTWEILSVACIAITFAILNQLHVITQWLTNPPDRLFTGIAHYYADYFLYVAQMAQGVGGNLLYAHRFTNEPLPPTWIYWFNVLLGNIGHLPGLSPFSIYNVSLFFLVIGLIFLWFYIAKLLYPTSRFSRWFFFLTTLSASSFFDIGKLFINGTIEPLGQFWFSPTPALNRFGGVPHQVFQTILFVLLILNMAKLLRNEKKSSLSFIIYHLSFGILVILAASANPIQMLVFVGAAIIATLWEFFLSARNEQNFVRLKHAILPLLFLVSISFPVAYITNKAFEVPVFAIAKAWEAGQQVKISLWNFLLSVGPAGVLALFGLRLFTGKTSALQKILLSYGALSLLFFFSPLPKLLGTTNVRYLHPAPYVLFALLATEGIKKVSSILYQVVRKKIPFIIYHLSFIILYLLLTLPSLVHQVQGRTNPVSNSILTSELNHVPQPIVDALLWLKQQPNQQVVLTDPRLPYDVLIPVLSDKTSFTGHPLHTLYPQVKEDLQRRFFAGEMSVADAKMFLNDHRIGYILASPPSSKTIEMYPYIYNIYKNGLIHVYGIHLQPIY